MRLSIVGLAIIGLVQAASANELDRVWLGPASPYGPGVPNVAPALPSAAGPRLPPVPPHSFSFEAGLRYGLSTGSLAKQLSDDPRISNFLNSQLTYDHLNSGTFEGYGRFDTSFGTFIKGYGGLSGLNSGTLKDEDFQPETAPYSATLSQQSGGHLSYLSIDLGQIAVTTARVRASIFAGYGHLGETANAYGCSQIAGNPQICVPSISGSVLAITEDTGWDFARLGILGEFRLLDRLTFSGEVAWLPYVQVSGQDTHWLRLGAMVNDLSGPINQTGSGTGVQIESILSYQFTDRFSIGLGGRYSYLQTRGTADLEQMIVGVSSPISQPLKFTTTRYGGFVQSAYRFGPF
jgi:hypothetical protein